jgi:hypothetical protein
MKNNIFLGIKGDMIPIPSFLWKGIISRRAKGVEMSLGFMSENHHLVRDFVVREIPFLGKPIAPEYVAQQLNLPVDQVNEILEELEKRLTFLFRNEQGAVTWAYPVTVASTPHHVTFSTGEQVQAA